jgi:hypothetical protein
VQNFKFIFKLVFFIKNWCKKEKIKQWLQLLLAPISMTTPSNLKAIQLVMGLGCPAKLLGNVFVI